MLASLTLGLLGGITVDLPPSVQVRGIELRLGDVAVITGEDEDAIRRARLLVLGQTPTPGRTRQLVRADIVRELGFLLGDVEVTIKGAPLSKVRVHEHVLAAQEQIDAARAGLNILFEDRDAELNLATKIEDLVVPKPRETISLRPRTESLRATPGPQGVPVEVVVDGVVWRTLWSSWTVEVYEEWPVLRAGVRAGETLTEAHFEDKRIRVSGGRITKPLARSAYGVATASRDLPIGYVVLEEDVTRAWTMLAGEGCQLEVKSGGISAHVRGQVVANCRVGDQVAVRVDGNQREVLARVVSKGFMLLDMTPPQPSPNPKPDSEPTPEPKKAQ